MSYLWNCEKESEICGGFTVINSDGKNINFVGRTYKEKKWSNLQQCESTNMKALLRDPIAKVIPSHLLQVRDGYKIQE
jgi:hypothetical protein